MKKIIFSMSALLMMVSCMNENETTPVVTGDKISYFTAGFETSEADDAEEAADSKTILNKDNNFAVTWVAEDPVTISDGSHSYLFKADSEGATTTLSPVETSLELPSGKTYYAHYPSDADAVWNGGKVTFTTPAEFTPNYGTFPYNASVAATNSSDFTFKNIGALIRFRVNRSNVTKVVFEAAGGEYLAGEVTVDCANPADITVTPGKGSTSVTVNGTLTSNQDYFIPVLPVNFSKGLTVTIYLSTNVYHTRTTQPFTLARSSRIEMGYITRYPDQTTLIPDSEYKPLPPRGSVIDASAPGGYYFPLVGGIDVAGELVLDPFTNTTDQAYTYQTYCMENGSYKNPCPEGWNLPTKVQLDYIVNPDNGAFTLDSTASNNPGDDYIYWHMRTGERSNGDIWGATRTYPTVYVLTNEMRTADQVWLMKIVRSSGELSVAPSSVAITRAFKYSNNFYILRCVRQAAN